MPLATDRDPSGVKQKNLSLTTGSQIGNLFLVRSLTTEDTETTDGKGTTNQTNPTNQRKLIGFGKVAGTFVPGKIGGLHPPYKCNLRNATETTSWFECDLGPCPPRRGAGS